MRDHSLENSYRSRYNKQTWLNPNEGFDCNNSLTVSTCPFWHAFNSGDTPSYVKATKDIDDEQEDGLVNLLRF